MHISFTDVCPCECVQLNVHMFACYIQIRRSSSKSNPAYFPPEHNWKYEDLTSSSLEMHDITRTDNLTRPNERQIQSRSNKTYQNTTQRMTSLNVIPNKRKNIRNAIIDIGLRPSCCSLQLRLNKLDWNESLIPDASFCLYEWDQFRWCSAFLKHLAFQE